MHPFDSSHEILQAWSQVRDTQVTTVLEHKTHKAYENILFGHALLSCDTISRVFGIGKGVALKQLRNSDDFNLYVEVQYSTTNSLQLRRLL